MTVRDLDWVPPPHDREQGVHAPQEETEQSTLHGCVLHASSCTRTRQKERLR